MPFLEALRQLCANQARHIDINNLTDDEFDSIAPVTKIQFEELYTYCDPVVMHGQQRFVQKKDLLTFLCKLR